MSNNDRIISSALNKIASSSVSSEKSLLGNYYISRTGIYCKMPGVSQKFFIGGFSCKNNICDSISIAKFEVAERALATYYLSDPDFRDSEYPLFSASSGKNLGFISAENVLLGPTLKNSHSNTDAVGLGFHNEKQKAIEHAVYEFLERYLLGQIWYKNHPLIKTSEETVVFGKKIFLISDFTINFKKTIPFIMTSLHDEQCNIFCIGAAFSRSMEKSRSKARAEAIMLASDLLSNKTLAHLSNRNSQHRMLSQKNCGISLKRKEYVSSLTVEATENYTDVEFSLMDCLNILGFEENDVRYTMLHESEFGYLARAVSHKLTTLRKYREIYAGTERFDMDAVC
jgi:hypothetical protein